MVVCCSCAGDDGASNAPQQLPSQMVMIARAEYVERLAGVPGSICVVSRVAASLSLHDLLDGLDVEELDDAPEPFVVAVEAAGDACAVDLDQLASYPR